MRTDPLNGGGKGRSLNRGKGSVVDSNFIFSEYDDKEDQETNETDSWKRDHRCNTRNFTLDGKYLWKVDTFGVDGIQGRHIAEYIEQRRPKVGMLPNIYLWGGV